jgi:RNA polymerase sigma-70 factor, ECF subfamily
MTATAGVTAPAEARVHALLAAQNPDGAAGELLRWLGPEIRDFLGRTFRDPEEAEEAYAIFEVDAWRGLGGWRVASSLRTWAYRVARNAAFRVVRDPWRRRRDRMGSTTEADLPGPGSTADDLRSRERRAELLDELRTQLSPDEDALIVLRVKQGLSWREVADVLAEDGARVDEAALRKRFERLKQWLAREARARGLVRGSRE